MTPAFIRAVDLVLRHEGVLVEGIPVAEALINEGLARRYTGGTRQGWCQ